MMQNSSDANSSIKYTSVKPSYPNADITNDFATNPLNKGKAEIETAPTILQQL